MVVNMNGEELVRDIKEDTSSGASEIMKKTVESLLFMSNRQGDGKPEEYFHTMTEFGKELILAQPTMAPVFNAVNTVLLAIESGVAEGNSSGELHQNVNAAAKNIFSSSHDALERIQEEAMELIGDGQTILTHSYSSTAILSLLNAHGEGRDLKIMVTESRPLLEGRRTAQILSNAGIGVTLIADMAAFNVLDYCDLVLAGCDCICHNGIVNKIGTKGLAICASQYDVPFFVVSEMSKVLPSKYRLEPEIKEKDPREIWGGPGNITVKNVYFDITPHRFIKGYITEKGTMGTSEVMELIANSEVSQYLIEKLS